MSFASSSGGGLSSRSPCLRSGSGGEDGGDLYSSSSRRSRIRMISATTSRGDSSFRRSTGDGGSLILDCGGSRGGDLYCTSSWRSIIRMISSTTSRGDSILRRSSGGGGSLILDSGDSGGGSHGGVGGQGNFPPGGGGGGGGGGDDGEDTQESDEFGPLLRYEEVMAVLGEKGGKLPPDMWEAAEAVGIRKLLLENYLNLQVMNAAGVAA